MSQSVSEKHVVSVEILKYPYCGKSIESKIFLSEKICSKTNKVRKKFLKKAKLLVIYADLILSLTNGIVPSQATQPIGLPIFRITPPIIRSINSDADLCEKVMSSPVIYNRDDKIVFTGSIV